MLEKADIGGLRETKVCSSKDILTESHVYYLVQKIIFKTAQL